MPTADVAVAASNRVEAAIELTRALIRVPTVDPAGCAAAADIVETELRAHGLVTERHDVMGPEGGPYPTVLAWLGERTLAPGLILSAHLDTSPPAPESTRDAYAAERSGGRIWGRGSTFAKSDVAVYLNAAVAARDLGIGASALVSITADEGQGGAAGPGHLLGALGISPARAITPGITRAVGYATNGAVQLHVTVTGRAAHQSLIDPDEEAMRHAVALGAAVAAEYDRLSELDCTVPGIAHPTINVTRLHGGVGFGMAAGTVELDIDRRVTPDEDVDAVRAELDAFMAPWTILEGVSVSYRVVAAPKPLMPTTAGHEWATLVASQVESVTGSEAAVVGLPLYTDARWFGAHGIPTVLFGAGQTDLVEAGINGANESVAEADIEAALHVVTRLAAAPAA